MKVIYMQVMLGQQVAVVIFGLHSPHLHLLD
jgi:hypothetical protein